MEFKTFKSLKRFVSVFYLAASCSKFGYVTFALLSGALKWFESVFHSVAITSSLVMYVTFGLIWYEGMFVSGEINAFSSPVVWMGDRQGKIWGYNK